MSTPFYDLASLVVVPSGYKASKVYAQKPLTTDGQLTFSRASTATRVNSAGLIEEVASNVPRLDYQGATRGPRLNLEPQRANVCRWSEQFDNVNYTKGNITITANQTISPDGTLNADKLTDDSTSGYHIIYQSTTFTASRVSASIYVKNDNMQFCAFQLATSVSGTYNTRFTIIADLVNGTITSTQQAGTPNAVYSIESFGSGWYRLKITGNHDSGNATYVAAGSNSATPSSWSDALPTYVGTGKSFYLYGGQLEVGDYVTSYVKTEGAQVTRLADACSKTGISSLIGQTEGTIYFEYTRLNNSSDDLPFGLAGSDGKLIWFRQGRVQFYGNGTTLIFTPSPPSTPQGGTFKVAFVYGQNDFRLYINGTQIAAQTSGTFTGSFNDLNFYPVGGEPFAAANATKQILLFKTKLTNAQLAELTTL